MNNKAIANKFNLLGKLLELQGENAFKTRSYSNAYITIRKLPTPLFEMAEEDIRAIPGFGKAIQEKVLELRDTGEMSALQKMIDVTPPGIVEMLMIKGLGPKKVKQLWEELDIESPGELLYACNENRLVALKGFGEKTQKSVKDQIEYHLSSKGKYHYATIEPIAINLIKTLNERFPMETIELTGKLARRSTIVEQIELIGTVPESELAEWMNENGEFEYEEIPFYYIETDEETFWVNHIESSSSEEYLDSFPELLDSNGYDEIEVYENAGIDFHPPYLREKENLPWLNKTTFDESQIIDDESIKGVVHNHSTYSDGVNTLKQMADATAELGYEYLVMTDHSKSAFYANGLSEERLYAQIDEIKEINSKSPIRVFSGIESDILHNGDLDYADDVLAELDVIVASVHSVLKMDEAKATSRLITAIENPYTRILGHPTGRLLLSRKGYPVDFNKVIDACAANGVVIEMNANPYRLDMDWRYIAQAMEKGVMISINPDAHSIGGINDIHYGVMAASKGGLTKEMCLNTKDLKAFENWVESK